MSEILGHDQVAPGPEEGGQPEPKRKRSYWRSYRSGRHTPEVMRFIMDHQLRETMNEMNRKLWGELLRQDIVGHPSGLMEILMEEDEA